MYSNETEALALRALQPSDRDFLTALYQSTRDDLRCLNAEPEFIHSLIKMQQQAQDMGYRHAYPDAEYLIMEHQGEAIGRLILNTQESQIRIVDISVLPSAQNKGYAKTIFRRLQQQAVDKSLPIHLSVNPANQKAKQLYLSLGFQLKASNGVFEEMVWQATATI